MLYYDKLWYENILLNFMHEECLEFLNISLEILNAIIQNKLIFRVMAWNNRSIFEHMFVFFVNLW